MGLWACVEIVPEPEATEVSNGISTVDSRISYTISAYVEPYSIEGLMATHKLVANIIQVEVDFGDRVRYLGLPDGVAPELGEAMNAVCQKKRKGKPGRR